MFAPALQTEGKKLQREQSVGMAGDAPSRASPSAAAVEPAEAPQTGRCSCSTSARSTRS